MTYVSLIVSFLILLCLVIAGIQDSTPLRIKVGWWTFQMSIPSVVFWAAAGGAAVVAVLSLPTGGGGIRKARREIEKVIMRGG